MRNRIVLLWLTVLLTLTGLTAGSATAAEPICVGVRLYAVAAETGNLTEMLYCNGFQQATVVDHGDWRSYRSIFAASSSSGVTVYAITADEELLSYRQASPGAELEAPTRVDGTWSGFRGEFASAPGVLHALDEHARLNTFVVSGTTAIQQPTPLLSYYFGPTITSVHKGGFAETNLPGGAHGRIWAVGMPSREGVALKSGDLPGEVTGVVGSEPDLFGVDGQDGVVLLRQQVPSNCKWMNNSPWRVVDRTGGHYERVVVPVTGTDHGVKTVADLPPRGPGCPQHPQPWEWQ